MNIYLATGAVLLVYLIFVWFLGNILHLHGRDIWVLRIGLGVIGIIGAGVFLWFKRREPKLAAPARPQDTGDANPKQPDNNEEKHKEGHRAQAGEYTKLCRQERKQGTPPQLTHSPTNM